MCSGTCLRITPLSAHGHRALTPRAPAMLGQSCTPGFHSFSQYLVPTTTQHPWNVAPNGNCLLLTDHKQSIISIIVSAAHTQRTSKYCDTMYRIIVPSRAMDFENNLLKVVCALMLPGYDHDYRGYRCSIMGGVFYSPRDVSADTL